MTPNKPTYHIKTASENSERIILTVTSNLTRYLSAKGRTRRDYLQWLKSQDAPWVKPVKVRRWKGMGLYAGKLGSLITDEMASICLAAAYMGKDPKEVMFSEIPLDRL